MKIIALNKQDTTNLSARDTSPSGYVYFGYENGLLSIKDGDAITSISLGGIGGSNFSTDNLSFTASRLHDLSSNTLEILGTGDYLGGWFYQDGSSIAIGNGNGGEPNQCRIRMIANGRIEMLAGNSDKLYVTSTRTEILSDLALTIGSFDGVFTHANTADRTYTMPDAGGTVAVSSAAGFNGTGSYTNFTIENGVITSAS